MSSKLVLETDTATMWHGDSLAVLADLPDSSVDAVITDPPYSSGGQFRGDRARPVHAKYVKSESSTQSMPSFTGDNRDQRGYGFWSALWIGECMRVLKPGGIFAVFTDWRQLPITSDVIQAGGVTWRGIVPWYKPNARRTLGRFANNCEYVVWGTNGPRPLDAGVGSLNGFFQASTPRSRQHITQKPLEIMRELVKVVPPGGVVLDPFAGAGTTGVAALLEGRRFVGIELADHYVNVAAGALSEVGRAS